MPLPCAHFCLSNKKEGDCTKPIATDLWETMFGCQATDIGSNLTLSKNIKNKYFKLIVARVGVCPLASFGRQHPFTPITINHFHILLRPTTGLSTAQCILHFLYLITVECGLAFLPLSLSPSIYSFDQFLIFDTPVLAPSVLYDVLLYEYMIHPS